MATLITLIQLNPPPIPPGDPTHRSADFFVFESVSGNLWMSSQIGIDATLTVPQVQALLDSEAAALLAAIQNDVPYATSTQALIIQYAASHMAYRQVFAQAWFTLEDGIRTSTGTLANYRTLLQATLDVINTLPTPFLTHFNNERTAKGLVSGGVPILTSVMTLAQCQTFDDLMHIWISSRVNGVVMAKDLNWWRNQ